jgi:hypothetical protein
MTYEDVTPITDGGDKKKGDEFLPIALDFARTMNAVLV